MQKTMVDHQICGLLTGTLPQLAQQNVFLGLLLELMPAEVFSPAKSGIAILIDEKQAHCAPTLEEASLFKAKEDTRIANDIRILNLREAERRAAMKDQYRSEIELTDMNRESQKSYISAVKCLTRKPSLYQDVPQQSYLSSSQPQLYVACQGPHIQLSSSSSSSSVLPETTGDGGTDDDCIDHQQLHCDPIDPEYILGSPTLEMVRGIDLDGNFWNFNKTKMIFYTNLNSNNNSLNHNQHQQHLPTSSTMANKLIMASFVQTCGSVPIFWTEIYNLRYKQDLKIMDVPQTQESMKAHFNQQVKIYGDQYLVNLVNSSGYEKPVKDYYERGVRELGNPRMIERTVKPSIELRNQEIQNLIEEKVKIEEREAQKQKKAEMAQQAPNLTRSTPGYGVQSRLRSQVSRPDYLVDSSSVDRQFERQLRKYERVARERGERQNQTFEEGSVVGEERGFDGRGMEDESFEGNDKDDEDYEEEGNEIDESSGSQLRKRQRGVKKPEVTVNQGEQRSLRIKQPAPVIEKAKETLEPEEETGLSEDFQREPASAWSTLETVKLNHSNQGGIAGEDESYDSDDGPVRNNKKKPGKVYVSIAISATTI
ncbi:SacI homology domain-domain-containing protein [Phakopsora pachyrhizi]|uniref:SacI homology domain-domain-containing protein n=1 Tax=Phakopsora pachyrhizi TaxID=170000 RepID=A0AAV0AJJ1_PHAPC|nr:SacI homology domain-domain-containing protein [Phakopsora pachyrhizi]